MIRLAALLIGFFWFAVVSAAERPNVLVIYTDDQGTFDANCLGSKDLDTPAIDELAATGITLRSMYAPSCVCSPSRAGLLTGRWPVLAGMPANSGADGMPTSEVTIAEHFQAAGYATGLIGKWHLGKRKETVPNAQGFDYSFGHLDGCIDNYSHYFMWVGANRHDLYRNGEEVFYDGQFFPDLMVDELKQFIDRSREKPWLAYWAINVPHYPYQGTEKWRERYASLKTPRKEYAAFLSVMDERVGEILAYLEDQNLRENTIVILQSDHGHSTEDRAFGGGGNAGELRGAKASLFEGGIRVPSFISWPAGLPNNVDRDQLVSGCDWFPTLCELCGVPPPERSIQGKSIAKVLRDDADSPHEELYWQYPGGENAQRALRQGKWKLLTNAVDTSDRGKMSATDKSFLVNLQDDPNERKNVAADHPDIVQKMQARLREIKQQIAAEKSQ